MVKNNEPIEIKVVAVQTPVAQTMVRNAPTKKNGCRDCCRAVINCAHCTKRTWTCCLNVCEGVCIGSSVACVFCSDSCLACSRCLEQIDGDGK